MSDSNSETRNETQSSLHHAAQCGDVEVLWRILADSDCVVDAIDTDKGWAALHFAADSGQLEACRVLLTHSADSNVRSGELIKDGDLRKDWYWEPGNTPLMLAASKAHFGVIELLIKMGADVLAEDSTSGTALHAACASNNSQIVDLLLSKGAKTEVTCSFRHFDEALGWHFMLTPLHVAANCGSVEAATRLLEHGAAISNCSITKRTPLIYAAARGHAEMITLLCKHGADPNAREHRREYGFFTDWTALHYAASQGHFNALVALLKCGAEPRSRESQRGLTALEVAEKAGHEEEVVAAIRQILSK